MIRVLIADDHAIVRTGLRALINSDPGMELVGEASGGFEAIQLVEHTHPDALVLDLSMPDLDGIEVTKRLLPQFPALRILILTLHEDTALLRASLTAGAAGYILKRAAEAELVSAIQVIVRGDPYVDPSMILGLVTSETAPDAAGSKSTAALTLREIDVLKLIVQGYTNRQIGDKLNISVRTVEGHRANLSEKLGMHSRVELVRYARDHGLIE